MRLTEIKGVSNTYPIPKVQQETVTEIPDGRQIGKQQEESDYSRQNQTEPGPQLTLETEVKDVSLSINKKDDFGYIGKESSLDSLDIKKAISDMKKDKVFEEYQYFVGGKPDLENDGDLEGNVFLK